LNNKENQRADKTQRIGNPLRQGVEKRLYSVQEASIVLGLPESSVRNLIYRGLIPYVKTGRRQLLDKEDMNIWIEKNKIKKYY
jgi:excisionase family DNA binding protein